jgi:hypothetical protein
MFVLYCDAAGLLSRTTRLLEATFNSTIRPEGCAGARDVHLRPTEFRLAT